MANPTPYERTYSFTDYQASNPSAPLPGLQVDNELENVETSLGQAIDAIKDVRRSDGKLKNGIVTVDSLSPAVAAGVGTGALASAEAAAASADAASDSAVAAAASATAASGSATAASGYASNALTSRNEASGFSDDSAAAASLSQTARDYASKWATEAEGVDVDDGVNPVGKSSYHWAQVALGAATGALPDNSVTETKILDGAVTTNKIADGDVTLAKLATDVTGELAGKIDASDVSAFTMGLFDDQNASEVLTSLGVSSFIQGLLDDTNGSSAWVSLGGTTNLGTQGAVKLPNGLMFVWGYNATPSNELTLTFHTSFPTACIFFAPIVNGAVPDLNTLVAVSYSTADQTGAYIQKRYTAGNGSSSVVAGGTLPFRWLAIGY